jgi:hypothetical protein
MRLSADLIARFQAKYYEKFAERISPEVAEAELSGLAELIRITRRTQNVANKELKDGEENGYQAIY